MSNHAHHDSYDFARDHDQIAQRAKGRAEVAAEFANGANPAIYLRLLGVVAEYVGSHIATEYDTGDYDHVAKRGERLGNPRYAVAFLSNGNVAKSGWRGHHTVRYFHIDAANERCFVGQGLPCFGSGKVVGIDGNLIASWGLDRCPYN